MIIEFLKMGGYGFYVWSSFFIVFTFCSLLFYRTRKTLKKYEKEFALEIEKLPAEQKQTVLESSKIASKVLTSYNKTI